MDRGSSTVSQEYLEQFCQRHGISGGYLSTSAKKGEGIEQLLTTIRAQIPWDQMTTTVTTQTFKRIKEHVLNLKEELALEEQSEGTRVTPGIILGNELSRNLGVSRGEPVTIISPIGRLTPLGQVPRSQTFRVVGVFDSGMYEYDSTIAYVSLSAAQRFLGIGDRVTGIEVRVKDIYQADQVARDIGKALDGYPYWSRDWMRMNKNLFSALKLESIPESISPRTEYACNSLIILLKSGK